MNKNKFKIVILSIRFSNTLRSLCDNDKFEIVGVAEGKPRKKEDIPSLGKTIKRFLLPNKNQFKEYSEKKNIPYHYYNSNVEFSKWLEGIDADIMIVYSLSQLIPESVFGIPKFGTINLHLALLPKYRGPNSWFWSYFNTEKTNGLTVHYIDAGEDTGNIICQYEYQVKLGMTSQEQVIYVQPFCINLLTEAIFKVCKSLDKGIVQNSISSTKRARNLKSTEHASLIGWDTWNIKRIWHLLRGTELWLNAIRQPSGVFHGHRWTIGEYQLREHSLNIGEVYKEKNQYFVVCSDGVILLYVHFSLIIFIKQFVKY